MCINWVKIGKQEPGTPFSKLLDPRLMKKWFWGYFHTKNLKINIDRKLYWIVHDLRVIFILILLCPIRMIYQQPKLWSKAGWTGQGRQFFLQTPKSKIDKNHSHAIFPYKNNNHIFYYYSEINQKGPPVRKTWLK